MPHPVLPTNITDFLENVPLAPRTTLRVGGAARYFVAFATREALLDGLETARVRGLPVFLLGGGSNLVIHDNGWPGLVATLALTTITASLTDDIVTVTAGAGVLWDDFVYYCVERGWAGIECLAGIPGTVGATPVQNVGAYGQEVCETITSLRALDTTTGAVETLPASACGFAYRQSRFNTTELGRWIVLDVTFTLRVGAPPTLRYRDLTEHFRGHAPLGSPSLLQTYHAVRAIRGKKSMVLDPSDLDSVSAGSFFKNPLLTPAQLAALPDEAPRYLQPDGTSKTSAAWLIESSRLAKGQALIGGVRLSNKHVLALVNSGGATATEIAASAKLVQARVFDTWGLTLHPEPSFVGAWHESPDLLPIGATVLGGL